MFGFHVRFRGVLGLNQAVMIVPSSHPLATKVPLKPRALLMPNGLARRPGFDKRDLTTSCIDFCPDEHAAAFGVPCLKLTFCWWK